MIIFGGPFRNSIVAFFATQLYDNEKKVLDLKIKESIKNMPVLRRFNDRKNMLATEKVI